ncbi:VirB4 family type IV secretion/conjugal transfer ATPase [Gallibacterium anatis]|uniref:VirB4 family type IV secretion/conjugal transfer ATPase n=1 Tax=Gallibacterium anatis TaxID=750 RepID=UPI003004AE5B
MLSTNPLFKALTRPALFLGMPLNIFVLVAGCGVLTGVWVSWTIGSLAIPILVICNLLTQTDDKIFQLLGIKRYLLNRRVRASKYKKLFNGNYYTAEFKNVAKKGTNNKGAYTMLDLSKPISIDEVIPYSSHISNNVILTKNGDFIATWEIEGLSYETRDDTELDFYRNQINALLRSMANENVAIYVHNFRNKTKVTNNKKFDSDFAQAINDSYFNALSQGSFFQNNLYVTLVYTPNKSRIEQTIHKKQSAKQRLSDIEKYLDHFDSLCSQAETTLSNFGVLRLEQYAKDGVVYSQQLEFFNLLLSANHQPVRVFNAPIYSYLNNMDLIIGQDVGQIYLNGKITYFKGIDIKDWCDYTHSGFLDILNTYNIQYVLTQSFAPTARGLSLKAINKQINQMKSTQDDAISQADALLQAKDELMSGILGFGEHHQSLIIYADDLDTLQKSTNLLMNELNNMGFLMTISNIALDETYLSQLPANFKFRPRVSVISTKNFADLNSLHNDPQGKAKNNCWGESVTVLRSNNGTPFHFNFHQTQIGRDDRGEAHLGHTLILGQSGAGKTVLATFLMSQSLAFANPETFITSAVNKKMSIFYFDKDYGAELAIRANGGKYNRLKNGLPTGFNPFMLDDTPENRDFLNQLMVMLVTNDNSTVTAKEREQISFAVKAVMSLDKKYRTRGISRFLENIQDDFSDENSIKQRLKMWVNGEQYGWIFDNEYDNLSFDEYPLYGFDGTEILDNSYVVSAVAMYILHRINLVLDGRRVIIFMDEFWKWLRNKSFEDFAYDGLKVIRKKNGFLVPITQSPAEIINSEIARTIIEQMETTIYLPNPKGQKDDYIKHFKCSEKEFDFITQMPLNSRAFLLKKGSDNDHRGNTTITRLDLSALPPAKLKVLSGNEDRVKLLDKIINQVGDNPNDWLPLFEEAVMQENSRTKLQ